MVGADAEHFNACKRHVALRDLRPRPFAKPYHGPPTAPCLVHLPRLAFSRGDSLLLTLSSAAPPPPPLAHPVPLLVRRWGTLRDSLLLVPVAGGSPGGGPAPDPTLRRVWLWLHAQDLLSLEGTNSVMHFPRRVLDATREKPVPDPVPGVIRADDAGAPWVLQDKLLGEQRHREPGSGVL